MLSGRSHRRVFCGATGAAAFEEELATIAVVVEGVARVVVVWAVAGAGEEGKVALPRVMNVMLVGIVKDEVAAVDMAVTELKGKI